MRPFQMHIGISSPGPGPGTPASVLFPLSPFVQNNNVTSNSRPQPCLAASTANLFMNIRIVQYAHVNIINHGSNQPLSLSHAT